MPYILKYSSEANYTVKAGLLSPIRIISLLSVNYIMNKFYLLITIFSQYKPLSTKILVFGSAANTASDIFLKGPFF